MVRSALPRIYRVTDPLLESVVFHGLVGDELAPTRKGSWEPILETIVAQRLAGASLDFATAFGVVMPEHVRQTLTAARYHERCFTLLAELSAATITGVLRRADVPFVVVKGPSIAQLDPVPGARPFVDADLLVPPNRFEDAMSAAIDAGFGYDTDRPARAYYERLCYEGVNLVDSDGRSIDIHHHVPPWWAGRHLTYEHVANDVRTRRIGGEEVPLAGPTSNLFIAALHLVSDRNLPGHKLLSWRDVMLTCNLVDPAEAAAVATETGLGWWLHWVLGQMPQTPAITSLLNALAGSCDVQAPRAGAARVKALSASGETGLNLAFAARLPARNAAAYLGGQLLPSKQSRAARLEGDESIVSWWRHVIRSFAVGGAADPITNGDERAAGSIGQRLLPSGRAVEVFEVLGAEMTGLTSSELADEIVACATSGQRAVITNHNLHSLKLFTEDETMQALYARSRFSFVDGMPLIWIGRLLGAGRQHRRTTCLDWWLDVFAASESAGLRVAHLGCNDATVDRIQEEVSTRFAQLDFDARSGFFDQKSGSDDNAEVLDWLAKSRPDIVLVGMGMPLQEHWIERNWDGLWPAVFVTTGACLCCVGGEQASPPRWMGRVGLEWLGRMLADPARLWHRYLVEPATLILPILRQVRRDRVKRS